MPYIWILVNIGESEEKIGKSAENIFFLWDMDKTKGCNGFNIQFRQSFTKKTFSYNEH